jgi:hypothetical protein
MPGDRHELLPDGRPGADDEDPRSDLAIFSEEDYLVASRGDHRDHGPTNAAWHWRYKAYGYDAPVRNEIALVCEVDRDRLLLTSVASTEVLQMLRGRHLMMVNFQGFVLPRAFSAGLT